MFAHKTTPTHPPTHRLTSSGTITVITLDPTRFSEETLSRCLSFLYTGTVEGLNKDSELLQETIHVARLLNLPELELICENAEKGEEFLNPSIGTWLNDRNGEIAKAIFLSKVRGGARPSTCMLLTISSVLKDSF